MDSAALEGEAMSVSAESDSVARTRYSTSWASRLM
jgi:hypothetical protein